MCNEKECRKCGESKPVGMFAMHSQGMRRNVCKECRNAHERSGYKPRLGRIRTVWATPCPKENAAFRNWPALGPCVGTFSPSVGLVMGGGV